MPFVGAFEQPNKLCLVVQYNSRGSLQVQSLSNSCITSVFNDIISMNLKDVLYNEDINLDWSFRASFLHDIVKVRMFK